MRGGQEIIELDAVIVNVLSERAFHARLANGHEIVAYVASRKASVVDGQLRPGDRVKVSMSPFDMSKGEISGKAGET